MKTDGTLLVNGLRSDFRFIWSHPNAPHLMRVETATGEAWVNYSDAEKWLTPKPESDLLTTTKETK